MIKQIISTESYLIIADDYGVPRDEFLHKYLPIIVRKVSPQTTFTSVGDSVLEVWGTLPPPEIVAAHVEELHGVFVRDYGVFERTFENGQLVRETYNLPAVRQEAVDLVDRLPSSVDLTNAFSIGSRPRSGPYAVEYITVYYHGEYLHHKTVNYGFKFDATTGEKLDTKLLFDAIPEKYHLHIPASAVHCLFGAFEHNSDVVDLYFSFSAEEDYSTFLGDDYVLPQPSVLGLGMVGVTIDTTTNSVMRKKRYMFGSAQ